MTGTESRSHDESNSASEGNEELRTEEVSPQECHETVDVETREDLLAEYGSRCQVCGRCGPGSGGLAQLHVHHIERNPDDMDEHDMANLTLLCRSCHSWFHQKATPADAPIGITEADQTVLLSQDIEILRHLAENGPARTGDIAAELQTELSVSAVRERLWMLMGLDNLVESRDRQIVDKDVETGQWGLTDQIENSARGHIPDDPKLLLQRMEDEQVRQALERGADRPMITEVLGISRRTTFHKHKRACAYDFPLDVFYDRGGRPSPKNGRDDTDAESDAGAGNDERQQRLDSVGDASEDIGRTETWRGVDSTTDAQERMAAETESAETDAVQEQVQKAISALEDVNELF